MSTWVDLKNNPRLLDIYNTRIKIIRLIREWFWSQGFVETDTPIAVKYAGQEPYLSVMPVTIHDSRITTQEMYLRTSPEYSLKKLLAAGYSKIFELGKCFRDKESFGGLHNPEFTMIEWYRAPGTLFDIMTDIESLFKYVDRKIKCEMPPPRGGAPSPHRCGTPLRRWLWRWRKLRKCEKNKMRNVKMTRVNFLEKWDRISMKDLWKKYCNVDLDNNLIIEQLSNTARKLGCQISKNDRYEDLFFKIFLNKIEPNLGLTRPVFVYNYPAQMCSLSKLCKNDPRYAERFELYIGGVEIANAFGELTNASKQKQRLEEDKKLRQELNKPTWPVDSEFIAALESGISKNTSGVALGIDRMVLLFSNARDINEVIFQSVSDQITNN